MDRRNAGDLRTYKTARKKQLESDQKSKKTYVQIRNEKRHTYRNYSEKTKYVYVHQASYRRNYGETKKKYAFTKRNTYIRSKRTIVRTRIQKIDIHYSELRQGCRHKAKFKLSIFHRSPPAPNIQIIIPPYSVHTISRSIALAASIAQQQIAANYIPVRGQ